LLNELTRAKFDKSSTVILEETNDRFWQPGGQPNFRSTMAATEESIYDTQKISYYK
jgi:hypothetical protein